MGNTISTFQNLSPTEVWKAPKAEKTSLLGKLKSLFVTPDKKGSAVLEAKRSFHAYFERQASALAGLLSDRAISSFADDVTEKFQAIVHRAFDDLPSKPNDTVDGKLFAKSMKAAGREAAMVLDRLKVDAARAEIFASLGPGMTEPQIIDRGPGKGVTVIGPAPAIENLVLTGGGAKGIGYSAALDQLEKADLLKGVKHLAGSSAGALTAACLAMGLNAREFEEVAADTLFRPSILDALRGSSKYSDIKFGGGLAPAARSLKLIDHICANQAHTYLSKNWNTAAFQEKLHALHGELGDAVVERLHTLAQAPRFDRDRAGHMLTFSDLALLHRLEPATFKQLTLTGWDKTNERETYFSAATTPDFPIAYAARISMAFPIAFKSVKADPGDGLGERTFADGGIGSNQPAEVFKNPSDVFGAPISMSARQREEINAKTAVFVFDAGNEAYITMHGKEPKPPHGVLNKIKSFFLYLVTSNPAYPKSEAADRHKVWDAGPNAVPIFHGEIGTLPLFGVSDKEKHKAQLQSAWRTLEYIDDRTQQAYHRVVDSLDDLEPGDLPRVTPAA